MRDGGEKERVGVGMVEKVNGRVQGTINRSFRDLSVLRPTKVTEFGSGIWNRHGIRGLGVSVATLALCRRSDERERGVDKSDHCWLSQLISSCSASFTRLKLLRQSPHY